MKLKKFICVFDKNNIITGKIDITDETKENINIIKNKLVTTCSSNGNYIKILNENNIDKFKSLLVG